MADLDPAADKPSKYTEAALRRHKREGLELAVRARWVAMAVIAVLLVGLNPQWEVLYYHAILGLLAVNGWLIQRVGRVGQSRAELVLIFADLAIMTLGMVLPNPLSDDSLPLAMQYRYGNFIYFFVILAAGTLAFSWRTVIAIGTWTAIMWTAALLAAWWLVIPVPELSAAAQRAFAGQPDLAAWLDPNGFQVRLRMQEVVVFLIVAVTLGFSSRRFNRLLVDNAALERERANLSRYFSPNVVDELSQNDEPLKQVRRQEIAVLFIDIIDFTRFTADRDPYHVIEALRGFHARMEAEVFRHNGTLDKYLGDGLMATFGTPLAGETDATNALDCARAMIRVMDAWNVERRRMGEPEIRAGIGVHYGTAVLGDIGVNRLEFAVIGTSVNVASRLETLSRPLSARLVISDALRARVLEETEDPGDRLVGLTRRPDQTIRGIGEKMTIWTLE
nr:adenylate/guanylate cyclase domain-containing protein [Antarcticimicrobium luteum]